MSVKYKIENAKLNKKLVGDTVTVSKVKKPHGDGSKGPRGPKTPKWFEDFVTQKFDPLTQRINNLEETVSTLENTVSTQFKSHGWTK